MRRAEAYVLVREKLHRFCEAPGPREDTAAARLVSELDALLDDVDTAPEGSTLPALKTRMLDDLIALGALYRRCVTCLDRVTVCQCYGERSPSAGTELAVDFGLLRDLGAL